jgi:hypothetical protein
MTIPTSDPIYREMLLDINFRLRLVDDLLGPATDSLVDALTLEEFDAKRQTIEQLHTYAQALQLIYTDFHHLIDDSQVTFPSEPVLWQWNEPNGDESIATTLERLQAIAEGLGEKVNAALGHKEASA